MASVALGVLCHHTAGPAAGNYPSLGVVRDGRAGLEGPLANLGLARDGTWIVVAAGQAWHAGVGSVPWCPKDEGNRYLIGVEAESVGTRDDWTPAQRSSFPRGVAALLSHLGLTAERAIGHKEWAPGRKIDPAFWDMDAFRRDVAAILADLITRNDSSDDPGGTEDMALNEHDMQTLIARLLATQIPDLYPDKPTRTMTLADVLAWAAANAGRAEFQAKAANDKLDALRADLDALSRQVVTLPNRIGPGPAGG